MIAVALVVDLQVNCIGVNAVAGVFAAGIQQQEKYKAVAQNFAHKKVLEDQNIKTGLFLQWRWKYIFNHYCFLLYAYSCLLIKSFSLLNRTSFRMLK